MKNAIATKGNSGLSRADVAALDRAAWKARCNAMITESLRPAIGTIVRVEMAAKRPMVQS